MDIRSQDKKILANADRAADINVIDDKDHARVCIYFSEDYYYTLGSYKNVERALEVFDEIQRHKHELKTPVYQMPEE